MSNLQKKSLFKSLYFWIATITLIVALFILFATPYFFDSMEALTLRLLISSTLFFGVLVLMLLYALFVKNEIKQRLHNRIVAFWLRKKYSVGIEVKVKDLKVRFNEAVRIIKNSSLYKGKRGAGYELPWYLMVGMETEGKTSLLESSGLDFPLNINYAKRSVSGDGATKSFQWYFAEHAIFVDMPGNYISGKRSEEDAALWNSFLQIFRKKRWKRPINGIILTISVDTLLNKSSEDLELYTKDLRDRFDEMANAFMSEIPIYLLVTKSDKIEGFSEYFSSTNEEEKTEVLGVTFDSNKKSIDTSVIQPELETLLQRLNTTVLDKIHSEWDNSTRSKILLFCNEFSVLFEKLNMFVDIGFAQTRYRKPLMLRGIYFTAAVKPSTALASQEFEPNTMVNKESKKGLFIKKVLLSIIFQETEIARMDSSYKKSQSLKHIGAWLVSIVIVGAMTTYWLQGYSQRLQVLDGVKDSVEAYDKAFKKVTPETDFKGLLISLNKLRDLKYQNEKNIKENIWQVAYFKKNDQDILIDQLYEKALQSLFLPRIAQLMERKIATNIDDYDLTWENAKAYAMLSNEKRRDNTFLETWLATNWADLYPKLNQTQNDLNEHFQSLISYGFKPYSLSEKTLALAKEKLLKIGHEELVYKELKGEAKKRNLKDFTFANHLGAYATAFTGSDFAIPGFYTKKGFEEIILADGKARVKSLVANNWVIGYSTELSDVELNKIYAKVQNYYFIDYKQYWANALSALDIPVYTSLSEINNQLTVFTSGTSPILNVLQSLKENTMLYTPAEELYMASDSTLSSALKENPLVNELSKKTTLIKAQKITDNTSIKNIREYFSIYNNLLDEENQPTAKLIIALSKLNSVYQEMTNIYSSVTPELDAYQIVVDRVSGNQEPIIMKSSSLPTPIDKWFENILKGNWSYLLKSTKKHINTQFKIEVLGYYKEYIAGRYPLTQSSVKTDVRLESFEEFFRTNGVLDSFYKNYLVNFIRLNTRRGSYRYIVIDGSTVYFNKSFINAMMVAADIRKVLFDSKGESLESEMRLKPYALGRHLGRMEYSYDGYEIWYEHGPIKSKKITWPPEDLNQEVSFRMYDLQKNRVVNKVENGDWAFFKLMDAFNIKNYDPSQSVDSILVEYKKHGYSGSFVLTGDAANFFTRESPLLKFKLGRSL